MRFRWFVAAGLAAHLVTPGCSCGRYVKEPHPAPSAADVLAELARRRAAATSFNHTSTMDFWADGQRIKTSVFVMGERGQKIRMNALDPAGGTTLADLACDGDGFGFVDVSHDCQLQGACTEDSIAALLRVRLQPDDFVLLALGQPPILPGALDGTVSWDGDDGEWVVDLRAPDGRTQRLELSGDKARAWDVRAAVVRSADGKVDWQLTQKDFDPIAAPGGGALRLPGKLRFEQPAAKADLIVDWDERALNPTLDPGKFHIEIPPGLAACGQRTATPAAPATR